MAQLYEPVARELIAAVRERTSAERLVAEQEGVVAAKSVDLERERVATSHVRDLATIRYGTGIIVVVTVTGAVLLHLAMKENRVGDLKELIFALLAIGIAIIRTRGWGASERRERDE